MPVALSGSLILSGSLTVTGSITTTRGVVLSGSQVITGSLTVSSSDATQLQVGSNLLFVSASGNVGIGTTNPVTKLQVEGGTLRIGDGGGGWSGFVFSSTLRQANNNPLTLLGALQVNSTAGSPSYISGSGGLAIGKTTANSYLDVNGNTTVSGSLTVTGSIVTPGSITAQTLVVQTITSSVDFVTGSTRFGTLSSNTHVFTGSLYVTGALYVATGSVGIGTTSPAVNFHVYSTTANTQVNVETLASGNSYTQYTLKSGTGAGAAFFLNSATRTTDGGANVAIIRNDVGSLRLQSAGSSGATDAGLTISGSLSYVGIGTTTPIYRLEVLGDGAGTGELAVRGSGTDIGIALNNTGTNGKSWRILSTGGASGGGQGKLLTWDGTGYGWVIDSSRNIGIGVTNPTISRVQIKGGNNITTAYDDGLKVTSNNETVYVQYNWTGINANDALRFAASGTEIARISGDGFSMGTGSVASNTRMHVAYGGAGKQGILVQNTGSDEATMRFKSAHSADSDFRIGASILVSNSFEIYSTRAAATRVYINSSGSTAFGTTTNVSQSYFSVGSVVAAGIMRVRAGQSNDTIRDTSAFGSSMSGTSDWSMVVDRASNGVANGALFRNGRNTASDDSPFYTAEANHPDCGGTSTTARFRLYSNGNGKCTGAWTGGGADYAEYFEWYDGNPDDENRVGYAVSLVENKIKIAESGETIIGVVSASPSVIGDDGLYWKKRFLTNDLGEYILDENGGLITNPEYDPNIPYVERGKRKEWAVVGLMGKIRMRKGQLTMPSWIKMRDISDTVEEWLIK